MNKPFLLAFIISLFSCNTNHLTHEQIITNYYNGLNKGDFQIISNYISDRILNIEEDFTLSQNKKEYYTLFQWDSVFCPKYELLDLKNRQNSIEVTVSKFCKRINFLQDSAFITKATFDFKEDSITKISCKYISFNLSKWTSRRDSLVAWTSANHPEIPNFLYDQTKEGAQNYMKAIELYNKQDR